MKEIWVDVIELGRAYLGVGLISWWGFWSHNVHKMPFVDMTGFLIHIKQVVVG